MFCPHCNTYSCIEYSIKVLFCSFYTKHYGPDYSIRPDYHDDIVGFIDSISHIRITISILQYCLRDEGWNREGSPFWHNANGLDSLLGIASECSENR